jgi:ubiquinone/menaquinone biosynthesis C-methylase UbiE
MTTATHNEEYKKYVMATLEKDSQQFCPPRKEKQMDYLFSALKEDFKQPNLNVLDACCGYGRLTHFLNEFSPEQTYVGIDYVDSLIVEAKERFAHQSNVSFQCLDLLVLSDDYQKAFDISICYKSMFNFTYYTELIRALVKATKRKIYITSPFHEGDVDFLTQVYANASEETGIYANINTYSLPKFKKFCASLGIKQVNTIDMALDFDLPIQEDKNRLDTYTIQTVHNNRLEVTGNIILNWKLVELVLT